MIIARPHDPVTPQRDDAQEARYPPPPMRGRLVRRTELSRRLDDAQISVTLVAAPAGYGKTTLLTQWTSSTDCRVAWLDALEAHADPVVWVQHLLDALSGLDPRFLALRGMVGEAPLSTGVLPALGRMLRRAEGPFAIVVDDAHLITERHAVEALEVVATNLAPGCRLLLGARVPPAIGFAALRARGLLTEIGRAELAMDTDEARALVAGLGLPLSDSELALLLNHTEGWPAGLVLAASVIRDARDRTAAIARIAGDDRRIAEYFAEEVLPALSADAVDLLVRTSVLDELTAPLCTAVLGARVTIDDLRALEERAPLVAAVDRAGERFRRQGLLTEMLRAELRRRDPSVAETLHRRAAGWYLSDGDHPHAVRHLVRAGDRAEAAMLVWQAIPVYHTTGRHETLRLMLAEFPEREVDERAPLALTAGWAATIDDSPMVAHWIRAAEASLAADADDRPELVVSLLLLRAVAAPEGATGMADDTRRAREMSSAHNPWLGSACWLGGVASHLLGDAAGARRLLAEAVDRGGATLASMTRMALSWQAVMALMDGDLGAAADIARRARRLVDEAGLAEQPPTALLDAVEAVLEARAGDRERSRARQVHGRRLMAGTAAIAPWNAVMCRILLSRAALQTGDDATAHVLMDEAAAVLPRFADAPVLVAEYGSCRAALDGLPAGAVSGPGALTTAELRVLSFLPTHLTYPQIGERLYLSRYTIKSHALSAFRKLGVSSRAEAVERARALGLVDG